MISRTNKLHVITYAFVKIEKTDFFQKRNKICNKITKNSQWSENYTTYLMSILKIIDINSYQTDY